MRPRHLGLGLIGKTLSARLSLMIDTHHLLTSSNELDTLPTNPTSFEPLPNSLIPPKNSQEPTLCFYFFQKYGQVLVTEISTCHIYIERQKPGIDSKLGLYRDQHLLLKALAHSGRASPSFACPKKYSTCPPKFYFALSSLLTQ